MISLPHFSICPKKYIARYETIISLYQKLFSNSLPAQKQYWTMCGLHVENGEFQKGSELAQILESGLIQKQQFYGIDIDSTTIEANSIVIPDVKWIEDDFFSAMKKAYKNQCFNPGIINADLLSMKTKGCAVVSQILDFIQDINIEDCMLICNLMLVNPHHHGGRRLDTASIDASEIISEFEKNVSFVSAWNKGNWKLYPDFYVYCGTGDRSRTLMGTFVFYIK